MPTVRRPDAVEIHWEVHGTGPNALVAPHGAAYPEVYAGLTETLAADHCVITYDPRGTGQSTRVAPNSPDEDVADLEALLEEFGPAVVVALGDAAMRAVALAGSRPDLIPAVIGAGATAVPPRALRGEEGLVRSSPVLDILLEFARASPRAAIRSLLELTNPGMTPEELRDRADKTIAYSVEGAIHARLAWFYGTDAIDRYAALGKRFWVAHWASEWSPDEVVDEVSRLLPESHVERVAGGAIERPDVFADLVRRAWAES